jgi:anti-sigma B factor antagonist
MPVPRTKNLWEKASSGIGPLVQTDGARQIPDCPWDTNGHPDLCVRKVGALTVVDLVNAEALFEANAVQELGERLRSLIDDGNVRLVLNLSNVRYASSSVVALLAWLYLRLDMAGGTLRLCGLDPVLHDMLRICHLDRVVQVYASETAAILTANSGKV